LSWTIKKEVACADALALAAPLTADEIAAKVADGTQDFVTLGGPDETVILRDDGRGGDAVAGVDDVLRNVVFEVH
jgi:hypothetical protein